MAKVESAVLLTEDIIEKYDERFTDLSTVKGGREGEGNGDEGGCGGGGRLRDRLECGIDLHLSPAYTAGFNSRLRSATTCAAAAVANDRCEAMEELELESFLNASRVLMIDDDSAANVSAFSKFKDIELQVVVGLAAAM